MPKEKKSPQEKKQDFYTKNHFTFGRHSSRSFPKTWKRKKANINDEYRAKADQLFAQAKPGLSAEDAASLTEEITVQMLKKKSVLSSIPRKESTVTVGEKVKINLETRKRSVGRRVRKKRRYDDELKYAISVLKSVDRPKALDIVYRARLSMCGSRNSVEYARITSSDEPADRALLFLHNLYWGSATHRDAISRNPGLRQMLEECLAPARAILERRRRVAEKNNAEQKAEKTRYRRSRLS